MTLLREIQADAAKADSDLAALLRKCKILAARLGSKEFAEWISWELDGYPQERVVPPYRALTAQYYANFMNTAWQANKQPFVWAVLGDDAYKRLNPVEFRDGIAKAAAFVKGAHVQRPELAFLVQGKMYPDLHCTGAWAEISGTEFQQLLSAVRSRILDFALEIEKANPDAGEAAANSAPVPSERLQPIVQNFFHAAVGNIAQNSRDFNQTAHVGVTSAELTKFVSEFRAHIGELGLSADDSKRVDAQLKTIEAQLVDEPNPVIVREAGRTIRGITEGAIGSLIAAAAQPHVWAWIHSILASF